MNFPFDISVTELGPLPNPMQGFLAHAALIAACQMSSARPM